MTQPPTSGHLDLDTLSELEEGLVDAAAQPAMRAHVDECEQCRDALTRLRTTRALVSTLPAVPMPPEVAARIDQAIAGAGDPTTVVPLTPRRRWRRGPTLAGGAAAAAVVLLVAAIVTGRLTHGSSPSGGENSASAPAAGSAGQGTTSLKEWQTGANYAPTTIASLVPQLVQGTPPAFRTPTGGTYATGGGAGGSTAGAPAPTTTGGHTPAVATPQPQDKTALALDYPQLEASPAAVLACARALNSGTPVTPVAVDFARFGGKPAVIVVLPTIGHPESLDVWVVRTVCSASSFDLYFRRIPRPAG